VDAIDDYQNEKFDLILLATKAYDALRVGPELVKLLMPSGTILSIQNGAVPELLGDKIGTDVVLGGLSNMGATMHAPGRYEQMNVADLRVGELNGGISERARKVAEQFATAVNMTVTGNIRGAIWAKLLINFSVTTIGSIAGMSMRKCMEDARGREAFRRTYGETVSVALKNNVKLERMLVEPLPPEWTGKSSSKTAYDDWAEAVLDYYGDVKPSMLQDFEHGRKTEIEFLNGHVATLGKRIGSPAPLNTAITKIVHSIERGESKTGLERMSEVIQDTD
jgi:2-dehydropantoate 2-reductase